LAPWLVTGRERRTLGTKSVAPGESGQDMSRIGGIFFQLSPQACDMRIDRSAAHRSTSTPYLFQQLDPGGDGSTPPHQRQQQPEFGTCDLDRLTPPKNGPGCRLYQNVSELDGAREASCSTGGQPACPLQQLLDPGNQLPHNRGIAMSSSVALTERAVSLSVLQRRHVYLELVHHWPDLRLSLARADVSCSVVIQRAIELKARLFLVIDDENSRNASSCGTAPRPALPSRAGAVMMCVGIGMSDATPTETELLEGYDRTGLRREEQIGSGMLLSIREERDLWYEAKERGGSREHFVTPLVFQS
jgi:hypothetical protein